jgi:hypothetical protein
VDVEPLADLTSPDVQAGPEIEEILADVAAAVEDLPEPQRGQASTAPRYDEVDLNELDALLDDMLSTAPVSGSITMQELTPADGGKVEPDAPQISDNSKPAQADGLDQEARSVAEPLRLDLLQLQEVVTRRDSSLQGVKEKAEAPHRVEDQAAVIESLTVKLEKQAIEIEDLRKSLSDMHSSLDKMAAEAAARVIREELAVLITQL